MKVKFCSLPKLSYLNKGSQFLLRHTRFRMWKQIKYQVRQPKVTKNLHYAVTQRIMVIAKYSIVFLVVNLQWAFWCFDFLVCDNEFRTTSCTVVGSVDCVNKRCWKDRHAMIYPVIVSRVPPLLTMIQLAIFDFLESFLTMSPDR